MSELTLQQRPATMRSLDGWRRLLWPAWLALLAAWTYALLSHVPVEVNHELFPPTIGLSLGKLLHVVAYAVLACGGMILPLRAGWRWLPIAILSVHTVITEYLQQFVDRTGCWEDVFIDHAGILVGVLLALCLSARRERSRESN